MYTRSVCLFLFVTLASLSSSNVLEWSGPVNELKKDFSYVCNDDLAIVGIATEFNGIQNDRRWQYLCSGTGDGVNLTNTDSNCTFHGPINEYKGYINFECPNKGYIAGFISNFSLGSSFDCLWRPYCCTKPNSIVLVDCYNYTYWVNDIFKDFNWTAPNEYILTVFPLCPISDRRWRFKWCKLQAILSTTEAPILPSTPPPSPIMEANLPTSSYGDIMSAYGGTMGYYAGWHHEFFQWDSIVLVSTTRIVAVSLDETADDILASDQHHYVPVIAVLSVALVGLLVAWIILVAVLVYRKRRSADGKNSFQVAGRQDHVYELPEIPSYRSTSSSEVRGEVVITNPAFEPLRSNGEETDHINNPQTNVQLCTTTTPPPHTFQIITQCTIKALQPPSISPTTSSGDIQVKEETNL